MELHSPAESNLPVLVIVDDDLAVLNGLKRLLRRDYKIHAFSNPFEVEPFLEENEVDLILSDEMMPGLRGSEMLSRIHIKHPDLCKIILSGQAEKDDIARAINKGGIFAFLFKPIDKDQLIQTITNGLENMQMRRHIITQNLELKQAYDNLLADLKMAQYIQIGMLPKELPKIPDITFQIMYLPSELVGGDYYNIFHLDKENIGIFFGDVTGHGVSAAMIVVFLAGAIRHFYKNQSPQELQINSPNEVMTRINQEFMANEYKNTEEGESVLIPAFYGILNTQTRLLTYTLAGHIPPLLIDHNGAIEAIPTIGGFPLGCFEDAVYDSHEIQLLNNQQLVFYTDGIVEARNDQREMFGLPRFLELLRKWRHQPGLAEHVIEELKAQSFHQNDDIALIMIDVHDVQRRQ